MIVVVVNVEMGVEMGVEMVMLKRLVPTAIPFPPLHPSLHPIPNQSKPIVPLLSFSPITFSYISYNFSLYLL